MKTTTTTAKGGKFECFRFYSRQPQRNRVTTDFSRRIQTCVYVQTEIENANERTRAARQLPAALEQR